MQKEVEKDQLAMERRTTNLRLQNPILHAETAKDQAIQMPTAGQKEVARKGKALGRGNQKRQRQKQSQQQITTMINCSHSVAPQTTQTSPKSPVYQNPS